MGAISFSIDEQLLTVLTRALPLKVFVETGTFRGDSLEQARKFFARCYSVEMSPELHQQACERFLGQKNLTLHLGESPEFLRAHQTEFSSGPTLFWLDAHWCVAAGTSGEDSQTPLLDELRAIGTLHPDSVVLIDDARLYLCAPPKPHRVGDWPDLDDVCRTLFALSAEHRVMIYNDVIVFYPRNVQNALRELSHEAGVDWLILVQEARAKHSGVAARVAKQEKKIRKILGKFSKKKAAE